MLIPILKELREHRCWIVSTVVLQSMRKVLPTIPFKRNQNKVLLMEHLIKKMEQSHRILSTIWVSKLCNNIGNWKSLANQFGIKKQISDQFGFHGSGPTEALFLHIRTDEKLRHLTMGQLLEHFREMERNDLVGVLKKFHFVGEHLLTFMTSIVV